MQQDDLPRFKSALTAVAELYGKEMSAGMIALWWQALERFEFEQVSKALRLHTQNAESGQFMPKPADLIRHLEGTATDAAQLAWGKLYEAMQRVGAYTDVVFDDGLIHAVVEDLGGWVKLCRSKTEELSYLQHRFTQSYQAYKARSAVERVDYPRQLRGDRSSDETYEMRGLPPPKPAIVGDVVQARLVWKGGATGARVPIGVADLALAAIPKVGLVRAA